MAAMHERVGIIVQARMASTRLPGKVLLTLEGVPILRRLCNRISQSLRAQVFLVATSRNRADDPIEEACRSWGIRVFRGAEADLVQRLLDAANSQGLTGFVRVTGDNPLTDYAGIDELIDVYVRTGTDLVHNKYRQGYPYGTGAEVISTEALRRYDALYPEPSAREDFILWMRRDPARFRFLLVAAHPALVRPGYFLTVDHPEDLDLMGTIYRRFAGDDAVPLPRVVEFLDEHPDLSAINRHLHEQFTE